MKVYPYIPECEHEASDFMAKLRLQKLFEDEARKHNGMKAIRRPRASGGSDFLITHEKHTEIAPEIAPVTWPIEEIAPTSPSDFPVFAEIGRQKFLKMKLEGKLPDWWNEQTIAHAQSPEAISMRQGPLIVLEQTESPETAVGQFADFFEGEGDFQRLCKTETGVIMNANVAKERWAAFRLQCEQTERLADALEAAGMRVRCIDPAAAETLADHDGRAVRPATTLVPVGEPDRAITLPNVQRLNAFPTVSAARHAEVLRSLRYIADRNPFIYMATLTSGSIHREAARLQNINAENKRFHAAIGALVHHRLFKRHAAPLLLGMEFGSLTPVINPLFPETDTALVHHHGHLLYTPCKWRHPLYKNPVTFSPGQWSRFRRWIRLRLAAHMHYNWKEKGFAWRERERGIWQENELHCELGKRLANINEACKYPIKGAELDKLLNEGGPELVRVFFEQTKGLRLITPYGELRKLRSDVKKQGKRFAIVTTPDGKVVQIVKNWNAGGSNCSPESRKNRSRWLQMRKRLKSPEYLEKIIARNRRKFARLIRPLLNRTYRILERIQRIDQRIAEKHRIAHHEALKAIITHEKESLYVEIRRFAEKSPVLFKECGFASRINAPWFRELKEYIERTKLPVRDSDSDSDEITTDSGEIAPGEKESPRNRPPLKNHLMARSAPFASGNWRVSQPCLVVIGYDGNFASLAGQNKKVAELAEKTRSQIAAALAAQNRVDALPPMREPAPAPYTRERVHGRAPARLPGSHYPHKSSGGSAAWPPQAEFWPPGVENQTLETAQN